MGVLAGCVSSAAPGNSGSSNSGANNAPAAAPAEGVEEGKIINIYS